MNATILVDRLENILANIYVRLVRTKHQLASFHQDLNFVTFLNSALSKILQIYLFIFPSVYSKSNLKWEYENRLYVTMNTWIFTNHRTSVDEPKTNFFRFYSVSDIYSQLHGL